MRRMQSKANLAMGGIHRRSSGFSLIEIVVAIAIIGLLIALLMPVLQSAREAARSMTCANNIKQFNLAIAQYAGAHGGHLPPANFQQRR